MVTNYSPGSHRTGKRTGTARDGPASQSVPPPSTRAQTPCGLPQLRSRGSPLPWSDLKAHAVRPRARALAAVGVEAVGGGSTLSRDVRQVAGAGRPVRMEERVRVVFLLADACGVDRALGRVVQEARAEAVDVIGAVEAGAHPAPGIVGEASGALRGTPAPVRPRHRSCGSASWVPASPQTELRDSTSDRRRSLAVVSGARGLPAPDPLWRPATPFAGGYVPGGDLLIRITPPARCERPEALSDQQSPLPGLISTPLRPSRITRPNARGPSPCGPQHPRGESPRCPAW